MYTKGVFGMVKCVLFIEVSSFQGVLIRGVPLYPFYQTRRMGKVQVVLLAIAIDWVRHALSATCRYTVPLLGCHGNSLL